MAKWSLNYYQRGRRERPTTWAGGDLAAAGVTLAVIAAANVLLVRETGGSWLASYVIHPIANAILAAVLLLASPAVERTAGVSVRLPAWAIVWGCVAAVFLDAMLGPSAYGC